jgi:hypothetical protein
VSLSSGFPVAATLVLASGCATPYAYRFERSGVGPPDGDVEALVDVDPAGEKAVHLQLTNLTDEPLQVAWTRIALAGPDGEPTALRPDRDLGWLEPGATLRAALGPFTLPSAGSAALAHDGQRFELWVPVVARREPRVLRYALLAHVQPRAAGAR